MRLYGAIMSPFVQRVLITARWKGQELAIEPIPGGGLQSPEFRAIAPMGRVPVIVDGDLTICESAACALYVDDVLSGPKLQPADPALKARHQMLASLIEIEVAAPLRNFMTHTVFGAGDAAELLAHSAGQIAKAIGAIEAIRSAGDAWAIGDAPGPADALLVPLLAIEDEIVRYGGVASMLRGHPGIDAYRAHAEADPVAGRTFAEIAGGFGALARARGLVEAAARRG